MPCAVVQHETVDQARVERRLVLHEHDLHHVQVDLAAVLADHLHGVDDELGDVVGEVRRELTTRSKTHMYGEIHRYPRSVRKLDYARRKTRKTFCCFLTFPSYNW